MKKSNEQTKKPVLVIIYNRYYLGSVDKIEYIYKGRFSHIYHLIPFYKAESDRATKRNIIPVHGNFFYFHQFIAQGLRNYNIKNASHYIFLSDDLMIHPKINESNYAQFFKLSPESAFIHGLGNMSNAFSYLPWREGALFRLPDQWGFAKYAYRFRRGKMHNISINEYLPDTAIAIEKFKKLGLLTEHVMTEKPRDVLFTRLFWKIRSEFPLPKIRRYHMLWAACVFFLTGKDGYRPYKLDYPLGCGVSDIVIIPQNRLEDFAYYCGVFASTNLFVEIAIPTAMILSQDTFRLSRDLPYKNYLNHFRERQTLPNKKEYLDSIENMLSHWPQDYIFVHPIKLSRMKLS